MLPALLLAAASLSCQGEAAAAWQGQRQRKLALVRGQLLKPDTADDAGGDQGDNSGDKLPEQTERELERTIKREVRKEVKREVHKEIEEDKIGEEVEAEIEKEVKEDLAEEGIGEEERISRIGRQTLEDKWRIFSWAVGFLILVLILMCILFHWGPEIRTDEEEDESMAISTAGMPVRARQFKGAIRDTTMDSAAQPAFGRQASFERETSGYSAGEERSKLSDLERTANLVGEEETGGMLSHIVSPVRAEVPGGMTRWLQASFGVTVTAAACLTVVLVPLGVCAWYFKWHAATIFWLNLLAIVPEAFLIGIATEELALNLGESAGALLNASFGNAAELIFVYLTLKDGLLDACTGSLVGSILSNHLVLLGFAFLFGGVLAKPPYKIRLSHGAWFNNHNALNHAQHLLVASFSVTLPAVFAKVQHVTPDHVLALSEAFSGFLVMSYVAVVFFQLQNPSSPATGAQLSVKYAMCMLILSTVFLAVTSEAVVHSLDDVCRQMGLSQTFVGVVLLPIAGDLSHSSAIYMAMKGKMDLAIDISLASSIQIALFVVPCSVGMGYYLGQPMTLGFVPVYGVMLVVSAIVTFAVLVDGHSNWLRGYTLLTTFTFVGLVVFFMPDPSH